MQDLIHSDKSRCNDYQCKINHVCARFRQIFIDAESGNKNVPVTDFKGRDKKDCDYFIN